MGSYRVNNCIYCKCLRKDWAIFCPADPPVMGLKLIFQRRGEDWWRLKLSQQENCIFREARETYLPSSQNMFFCGQKVKSQGHPVLNNMSPQHNVLMWFLLYRCAQQNVQDYVSLTARSNVINILKFEEIIYKNRKTLLEMNPQIPPVWLIFTGLQTIQPFFRDMNKIKLCSLLL